jgi:C_GCAxxG_C_C family probable redox protein
MATIQNTDSEKTRKVYGHTQMEQSAGIAAEHFDQGFNCAQSVLAAFTSHLGLSESQALKLASPFGGGIARRGQVCGAVSGALLVLGLARGSDTPAGKEAAYQMAQEFLKCFEDRHASILCRDLLGCDISTPEDFQRARQQGLFSTTCPQFVLDGVDIVQSMLAEF